SSQRSFKFRVLSVLWKRLARSKQTTVIVMASFGLGLHEQKFFVNLSKPQENEYYCPFCGKRYYTIENFNRHMAKCNGPIQ
ncbi:hypothetical protein BT69DRAFT_1284125, partial [Atractiella rhizophila]